MKTKPEDILFKKFGKLTVLCIDGKLNGKTAMRCVCDCGETTHATVSHLVQGRRLSCGCAKDGNPTHGMRYTRAYSIWCDMWKRCTNPNSISFQWYGAKGITVCNEWKSFMQFYIDMGEPPDGLTIDRIDPTKGYSPDNCRWATAKEQAETRLDTVLYCVGEGAEDFVGTLPSVAEHIGIKYKNLYKRIRQGKYAFGVRRKEPK